VWVRPGTYVGFVNSNAGWTQVTRVAVVAAGAGNPTPVPITTPFTITAGSVVGVYLTTGGPGGAAQLKYINGFGGAAGVGTFVWRADAFLTITEGSGGCCYFNGGIINPRNFSGNIHYSVGGFNCGLLNPPVVGQWGLTGGRCGDFVSTATSARYESTLFGGPPPPVQRVNAVGYAYEVQFVNNRPQQPTAAASIFVAGSPIPLQGAAQWWDRAIAFNVSATGKYSIFRYNGLAKPVPLQAWVTPVIPLNLAPAANRLRVEVIGPNLVFSINGNVVRTLPDLYGIDQFGMGFVRTISTTGNLATDDWMEILDATTGTPPPEIEGSRSVSPAQQRANDAANAPGRDTNVNPMFAPR
jgi:hypothetical protein